MIASGPQLYKHPTRTAFRPPTRLRHIQKFLVRLLIADLASFFYPTTQSRLSCSLCLFPLCPFDFLNLLDDSKLRVLLFISTIPASAAPFLQVLQLETPRHLPVSIIVVLHIVFLDVVYGAPIPTGRSVEK